mmetsp:Transcript_23994/g.32873  ORF Transcript_23994/g.32873 Transcript_23994/m.32873 type:complete len:221 (+) Transcript_23994:83-745(+)
MYLSLFILSIFASVNGFQQGISYRRFSTPVLFSESKGKKYHETQIDGAPTPGTQYFAADVGVPALIEDYGGGDVGGNDYKDSLFHYGPRGTKKPKITDVAVVKVPDMATVERGYSEAKAAAARKAANYKTGPWTDEEDQKLREALAVEKEGVRGRWERVAKVMRRPATECSLRWVQVLNPNLDNYHPSILIDAERVSGLQGKGLPVDEKVNWMNISNKNK